MNKRIFQVKLSFCIAFLFILIFFHFPVQGYGLIIRREATITKQDTLIDVEKVQTIISKADSSWIESYERKIPKKRIIFKKGKVYHYKAIYISSNNDTLSNSFINIIATGDRWNEQPETQDLIYYEFPNYRTDSIKLSNHYINKELHAWKGKIGEGVIENIEQVWMHPIRANQYKFTEVAPFPEVHFPLQKGKKWKRIVNVIKGWGEWNGQTVISKYKISGQTTYQEGDIEINCWIIKSVSKCSSGKSKLNTFFNEEWGFVKMEYHNYENEKLVFELVNVEEK